MSVLEDIRSLVVGTDREVPLLDGTSRPYVNLDNAATTPPFREVMDAVNEYAPWYSSIHRGTGYKSHLSTRLYEQSRETVASFVGADPEYHSVIFCCNTTDSINKFCRMFRLAPEERVLTTVMEHHSNLLPWRMTGQADYAPILIDGGELDMRALERTLVQGGGKIRLVAVTAASNVTGFLPPIRRIARLAHEHGAQLMVDAAQLIAHRPMTIGAPGDPERIDFLCFSAHKMYAPFGCGALVGPREFFERELPPTFGGGAVELVSMRNLEWAPAPDKDEAGTPNVIGALAMARACQTLQRIGMNWIADHERALTSKMLRRFGSMPLARIYGDRDSELKRDRVGVVPLIIEEIPSALLAAVLSYEYGIAVRHGCFCAHPYVEQLLGLTEQEIEQYSEEVRRGDLSRRPGFVRVSLGLYNTEEEIDYIVDSIETVLSKGPAGRYNLDPSTGEYAPEGYSYELPFEV